MIALRVGLGVLAVTFSQSTFAFAQETELIARVQRVMVASLDSALPAVAFGQWLTGLRKAPQSEIRWEVNDCGEGGDGLSAPVCAEAILDLGPDTTAHVTLGVADRDGKPVEPGVWMLYVMVKGSFTNFERLSKWEAYIRNRTRPR